MVDRLVLERRIYAPRLGREVTLRLIGLAAELPNYWCIELAERMNSSRAVKVLGVDPTRVPIPAGYRPIPRTELPPELAEIRFSRWTGKYFYMDVDPYVGRPTSPVIIYGRI